VLTWVDTAKAATCRRGWPRALTRPVRTVTPTGCVSSSWCAPTSTPGETFGGVTAECAPYLNDISSLNPDEGAMDALIFWCRESDKVGS
jgi:hypothetical protein